MTERTRAAIDRELEAYERKHTIPDHDRAAEAEANDAGWEPYRGRDGKLIQDDPETW